MKPTVISINKVDDLSRDPLNIYNDTFLLGYRGSLAHNMYVPGTDPNSIDDVDLMGFSFGDPKHYLGLTEWGSRGTKEFWHYEYDCVFYEAKKAISLLLQGNPNIMSMLWLRNSDYLYRSPEGYSLLNNKQMFVGKHVYHSFAGYASAQLLKMETREPAQIREYLGVTYEMKRRGIHPTDQSLPDDVADATDCSSWGDEVLRARWSHYSKKGENMGYMGDKRKKLVLKVGYDCYKESSTEFLTASGWKVFDQVLDSDTLIVVDPETGSKVFSPVMGRTDKLYTGLLYTVDVHGSKAEVTPNHNLLVSPAHRNTKNSYSTEYVPKDASWRLCPIQELIDGKRSHFHIRRAIEPTPVESEQLGDDKDKDYWLALLGLFLSDGTFNFEPNGKLSQLRLSQQPKNTDFCEAADSLIAWSNSRFGGGSKHTYEKETVWCFPVIPSRIIYDWCGHSKDKHLPNWCFSLTQREAYLFWEHLCYGDGSEKKANDCYYSSVKKLASDIQAMMVCAGFYCTMYGPYSSDGLCFGKYERCDMYHVVLPTDQKRVHCLNLGRILKAEQTAQPSEGFPIKEQWVADCRVVCLESTHGTLITRNSGKVAIQGNSKNAAHCIRLLRMAKEFLGNGEMVVHRLNDAQELLDIKRGAWELKHLKEYAEQLFAEVKEAYLKSPLPPEPDRAKAESWLIESIPSYFSRVGLLKTT